MATKDVSAANFLANETADETADDKNEVQHTIVDPAEDDDLNLADEGDSDNEPGNFNMKFDYRDYEIKKINSIILTITYLIFINYHF